MIICTKCNHQNPEGSVQCENCYAPLPQTSPCPHCGAFVQTNATFCGQCGYNLQSEEPLSVAELVENSDDSNNFSDEELNLLEKDTVPSKAGNFPLKSPWDTDTGEQQDVPVTPNLSRETDLMSSGSLNFEAEVYQGPADEVDEVKHLSELENLAELERVAEEQFSLDTNSENDSLDPDSDPDLAFALEAELPEMSDIEELEATTARLASEIPEIPEPSPLEELEVDERPGQGLPLLSRPDGTNGGSFVRDLPLLSREDEILSHEDGTHRETREIDSLELDFATKFAEESAPKADEIENLEELELVAAEQFFLDKNSENNSLDPDSDPDLALALEAELPEMSDIEELEATTARLASEISESSPLEELEVDSPELDVAAEIPDIPESSIPIASEISAVENPRSSSNPMSRVPESATQLQLQRIILFHVQTETDLEISQNLDIIRIGKPNSQIPPDIDVSGFPDSNIVSRVHANIRVEGDAYFLEDLGSSNGTYINHKPLLTGNRHRLRSGDRISLGKGDLMTFIFKIIDISNY